MKTITLTEAYEILQDSSAIIIDDGILTCAELTNLKDDESNEFLNIEWDEEGLGYNLQFNEGDNQEVKVSGSSIFLLDTDSEAEEDAIEIIVLTTKELE
jgi:hypothetical protein